MRVFTRAKGSVFLLLFVVLSISGCSSVSIETYRNNLPVINVKSFFNGKLSAHGIVKNRSGKVIRYFNATIKAYWTPEGNGILDENFIFDDGEQQRRVWTLKPLQNGKYLATAGDVVGDSILDTSGNALFLKYTLTIPYKEKPMNVRVDDRMYLLNDTTLINESIMTKFGFEVAYVTLVISKHMM